METINDFKDFSFSTKLAVISFILGTSLFILYFIFPEYEGIIILGLIYVIFALFFNGLVLLNLLLQLIEYPSERENIIIKILIQLANIPIALLYFLIIVTSVESNSPF